MMFDPLNIIDSDFSLSTFAKTVVIPCYSISLASFNCRRFLEKMMSFIEAGRRGPLHIDPAEVQ